jgi:RNA binding exosome subunit
MKTAMQDMIEWIEQRFNNPQETEVFKKAIELLEKEKEQIRQAFQVGIDEDNNFYVAEKYYNKTYNQKNKL